MRLGCLIVTIRSSCLGTLEKMNASRLPLGLRVVLRKQRVKKHMRLPPGWPVMSRRTTTVRRRIKAAARASSSMSGTGHKAQIEAPPLSFDTEEQHAKWVGPRGQNDPHRACAIVLEMRMQGISARNRDNRSRSFRPSSRPRIPCHRTESSSPSQRGICDRIQIVEY